MRRLIDFHKRVTMPIRDMERDGKVVFLVDIYGVDARDLTTIGGDVGSRPMMKAVERIGLDPHRYQAWIWDIPL